MNIIIIQTEVSLKTYEILKKCAELNKVTSLKLASMVLNSWDGNVRLFQAAHKHKLNVIIEDYDNIRMKGVGLDIIVTEKTNSKFIKILNNEKYCYYTKRSMARDILISFLIHRNNKLINAMKEIDIACEDCMDILTRVAVIDETEKYVPLYKREGFGEVGFFSESVSNENEDENDDEDEKS